MRYSVATLLAFAATALAQTAGFDVLTEPTKGESVPAGETFTIEWESTSKYASETVTLSLLGGSSPSTLQVLGTIASGVKSSAGKYDWAVNSTLGSDATYGIQLTLDSDKETFQYSFPFVIAASSSSSSAAGSSSAASTAAASTTAAATTSKSSTTEAAVSSAVSTAVSATVSVESSAASAAVSVVSAASSAAATTLTTKVGNATTTGKTATATATATKTGSGSSSTSSSATVVTNAAGSVNFAGSLAALAGFIAVYAAL